MDYLNEHQRLEIALEIDSSAKAAGLSLGGNATVELLAGAFWNRHALWLEEVAQDRYDAAMVMAIYCKDLYVFPPKCIGYEDCEGKILDFGFWWFQRVERVYEEAPNYEIWTPPTGWFTRRTCMGRMVPYTLLDSGDNGQEGATEGQRGQRHGQL